jgi:hypothetical protein
VYHQILVNAGDELQVTFDDNKDDNCWSYHRGGNYPNVSELFHMNWVSKDNNEVEIFGYLPPPSNGQQTIWYLTVLEDGKGVPERHPKFRPAAEQEPMQELMLCVTHQLANTPPPLLPTDTNLFTFNLPSHVPLHMHTHITIPCPHYVSA